MGVMVGFDIYRRVRLKYCAWGDGSSHVLYLVGRRYSEVEAIWGIF